MPESRKRTHPPPLVPPARTRYTSDSGKETRQSVFPTDEYFREAIDLTSNGGM